MVRLGSENMCTVSAILNAFSVALQAGGVIVILIAQGIFYFKARKEYGPISAISKAFIDMAGARAAAGTEELRKMGSDEVRKLLEKFTLARFVLEDIQVSVVGLTLTLIGLIIEGLVI